MLFTKWLNEVTDRVLRKRTSKFARKARKVSRRSAPTSEALETRIVPATINIDLTGGVLTITGDADPNTLTISASGGQYTLNNGGVDAYTISNDDSGTAFDDTAGTLTIGAASGDITSVVVNLGDGDDTVVLASTEDAIAVDGEGGSDTVQGPDATTVWSTTGLTVSGQAVTFANVETLQGGAGNDSFNIGAPAILDILGGAGNDVFNVNAELTGSINGEGDSDTLAGSQIDDVLLTGADSDGFAGTETEVTGGFSGIDRINSASGTLTGMDTASTWTLSGTTSTYSDGVNSLTYSGFSFLQGGTGDDTFNVTSATVALIAGGDGNDVFDVDAKLTGSVDGEGGTDTLQGNLINNVILAESGFVSGTAVDGFAGSEGDVTQGFDNIDHITGNNGTLRGLDEASTWDLVGGSFQPTYTSGNSLTFDGFRTLQGGSEADEFNINTTVNFNLKGGAGADIFTLDAALTGSIDGGADEDALQGSAVDNVTLTSSSTNGFSGNENSLTGGFAGIDLLIGNGSGTLTGISVNSTWTLDGAAPQYTTATAVLDIDGFTSLQGGSAIDIFNVTGDSAFDLNGGLGNDKINILGATLNGTANGGGGNDTLDGQTSTGPVTLLGGDGNDVVIGSAQDDELNGGLGNDRLFGLAGDDLMTGGAGNDSLVGGDGNDRLVETVNGNATITNTKMTGGNGSDTLSTMEEIEVTGNANNNLLDASAYTLGAVTLNGGDGNDTLAGGASFGDVLDGGDGDDVVRANVEGTVSLSDADLTSSGITDVLTSIEAASLTGSATDDDIDASGFSGSASISGGAGNDTITGAAGPSLLNGQAGNDVVTGQGDNDSLLGGAGHDTMDGGDGDDRINGNDGDDSINGGTGNDTITGDGGRDEIFGGDDDDRIDAGVANDTVFGEGGNDSILGGNGLDSIEGGDGDDTLNGQADADRIEGGEGNDQILGGAGHDVLLGEAGDDSLNSQGGNDTMIGGDGDDTLTGGAGNELMFGGDGNDFLNGQAGNDTLIGDDGDDTLLGGAGNDLVLGGLGGDDSINGGAGKDTVGGGGDQDVIADPAKERVDNATHDDFFSQFDSTVFLD